MRFYTADLWSKWGFSDGDILEPLMNRFCDEQDVEWINDHPILIRVVQEFVLPRLDRTVEVVTLSTVHNPIRAKEYVDGLSWEPDPPLAPEYVDVPDEEILRLFRESIK